MKNHDELIQNQIQKNNNILKKVDKQLNKICKLRTMIGLDDQASTALMERFLPSDNSLNEANKKLQSMGIDVDTKYHEGRNKKKRNKKMAKNLRNKLQI